MKVHVKFHLLMICYCQYQTDTLINCTKVCSLQRESRRLGDIKITVEHGEVLLNCGVLLRRQTQILGITDALSKWDLNRKKEISLQSTVRHVWCPITFQTVY